MSVTVLTPADTFRLTTLEAVMHEIVLEDQLLFVEGLLDQASAAIARACGTIFAQQEYREIQGGDWCRGPAFFLRYRPIISVSSVTYGTEEITDYRIESAAGMLLRRTGWPIWWHSDEEWTVDYIAGYILPMQLDPPNPAGERLPDDIERATIETIKVWFDERLVSERVSSRTLGDQRIDYGLQSTRRGIPMLAKDLLMPWRQTAMA